MRRNVAAITVSVAVIAVGLLSFALLRYVNDDRDIKGQQYYALFNDALGLFDQSRVQTAGIRVGRLLKKELADPEPGRPAKARVWVEIDRKVVMYENASIAKKSASLLGEFYLEVDPGTPVDAYGNKVPELKPGSRIGFVYETVPMAKVVDQVSETIPVLREILVDVRRLTAGPITDIADRVNESVERNAAVLERLLVRVDSIAADVQGITSAKSDEIMASIDNVRDITEGIKDLVGTSQSEVEGVGDRVRTTLDRLQDSVAHLERTLGNTAEITDTIKEGEGTVGRLLTDETVVNNIEDVTSDIGDFVGSVTKLQTIVGLRTEYNFFANTFKNYVSIKLAPRPDKYYLIELVDDPRGFRQESLIVEQSSSEPTTSTKRTEITEALRFTFMFAKRVGPLTGRFGILESTGGAGLDLHLSDDRLMLQVDVFDTRSNVFPRVRGRVYWAVYKKLLWVVAGADDILNTTRSSGGGGAFIDGFIGAQLTFNDEDLKTLLLFGGSSVAGASGAN